MNIRDHIAQLVNPSPKLCVNDESEDVAGKLVDRTELLSEPGYTTAVPVSKYKAGSLVPSLLIAGASQHIDVEVKYKGAVVSREHLDLNGPPGTADETQVSNDDLPSDDNSEISSNHSTNNNSESVEEESNNDDDEEEVDGKDDEDIEDEDIQDGVVEEDESARIAMRTFSEPKVRPNELNDVEKGLAIQRQYLLWEALLALRMKFQKILNVANQLPQNDWIQTNMDSKEHAKLKESRVLITRLLTSMLELEDRINGPDATINTKETDDEEIDSDEADGEDSESGEDIVQENDEESDQSGEEQTGKVGNPRKRGLQSADHIEDSLMKRHKSSLTARNTILLKWHDKIVMSKGSKGGKDFSSFKQNIVKQIEQITADEARLLKRTQLKRSSYIILGKGKASDLVEDKPEPKTDEEILASQTSFSNRRSYLRSYDEEIFDDDDFYQQLLRALIERKSSGSTPAMIGEHWTQMQRLRNTLKKQVDTGASKGRKVRYDVVQKLVSFMAPVDCGSFSHDSRDELFSSLFGKNQHASETEA